MVVVVEEDRVRIAEGQRLIEITAGGIRKDGMRIDNLHPTQLVNIPESHPCFPVALKASGQWVEYHTLMKIRSGRGAR